MSVWISEASPRQYSFDELVRKILGCPRCVPSRSRSPPLSRYRVDLGNISEWRGLPHPRPQRVGRLSEALIEVGTAPSAGDMDEVAVEHRPFALVLVQAETEDVNRHGIRTPFPG